MHPNPLFHLRDAALMRAIVGEIGFGQLFAQTPDGPRVAHVPVLVDGDQGLLFHLARGNALTRHLDGLTALFVCNGPDGYISPDWYGIDDQVPTWNYLAIEVEGVIERLSADALADLLERTSAAHEARLAPKPAWHHAKMAPGLFDRMQAGIVGFRLDARVWRGTAKLGQNKPEPVRLAAAAALELNGQRALAALMREIPA